MQVARLYASATLLANGKVLIAGGMPCDDADGSRGLASAELYDPETGTFTMTGALTIPRDLPVATLLKDGIVLVVGGDNPGTGGCTTPYKNPSSMSHLTADMYDPTTGKFTRVGSPIASVPDTATLLPDGRVVTADADSRVLETYDPATGKFARSGSLLRSYEPNLSSTLLPDGEVLFVGLVPMSGPRAEIYDPATGKSRSLTLQLPASATIAPRDYDLTAPPTTLKDGRVLLCIFDYLEIYDPSTGFFTAAGSIAPPELWLAATATLLSDGDVLFAGGEWNDATTAQAGIYDPANGFHQIGLMTTARELQTATLLPDGRVLIAGGSSDVFHALSSAELFVP
jgi:WD40 repeat protein